MSEQKVKFTQRLSVRLTAVASILALGSAGAFAVARPHLGQGQAVADQGAAGDDQQEPADLQPLRPIPLPTEQPPTPEGLPNVDPADGSHATQRESLRFAPSAFSVPSPRETVIRGNDGGEVVQASAEEPVPDSHELPDRPPATLTAAPPDPTTMTASDEEGSARDATPAPVLAAPVPAAAARQGSIYAQEAAAVAGTAAAAASAWDRSSSAPAAPPQFAPPAQSEDIAPLRPTTSVYANAAAMPEPESTPIAAPAFSSPAAPAPLRGASAVSEPTFAPARSLAANTAEGDGTPGAETLDGEQTPALSITKAAPPEIQVGKETQFEIKVRNVGRVAAHDVVVLDRVPKGTQFVNASPQAERTAEGQILWQVGTLQPGDETLLTLHLLPTAEGEIGSVAQVVFQAQASARTLCTKPLLTVKHTGPQKAMIGDTITFDITVTNPGTGAATGVVLEEDIPEGLAHAAGRELELELGTLRPGETRQMRLSVQADKPGQIQNTLLVRGEGNVIAQDTIDLEIVAPALEVALTGPKLRYLERPATYEVAVTNPGTASAREVELVTYLPKGLKFVSADHKGQYEPQNHAVYWSLEELPPSEKGTASLTLLPIETGEQKLSLEGRAAMGLQGSCESKVQVESLAELQFTIKDEADPIEVGSDTTYVITLTNSGSSAATNVELAVNLPPQLKPVGGDGPTRVSVDGNALAIDTLARLGPGEQAIYKIKVQGLDAGPQRIQVQLVTAEVPVAVTREEITRVYADR